MIKFIKLYSKFIEAKFIIYLACTLIFIIISALCNVSLPLILRKIVDQVSLHANHGMIFKFFILYTTILFFEKLFNEIQFFSYPKWENGILEKAYAYAWGSLFNNPPEYFKKISCGEITSKVHQSIAGLDSLMFEFIFKFFPVLINFTFIVATVSFSLNIIIGGIISAGILGYVILMHFFNRKITSYQSDLRKSNFHIQGLTTDLVFSWKDIYLTNSYKYVLNIINKKTNLILEKNKAFYYRRGAYGFLQAMIICIVIVTSTYYVILNNLNSQSAVGDIILLNNYLLLLLKPVESFSLILRGLSKSYSDFMSIEEFFYVKKELKDQNKFYEIENIRLYNIAFGNVLNNISLTIRKGEKIAIIGDSGSGKSTLFNILTGICSSYKGEIFINENKLQQIDSCFLEKFIAYCSADARLISDSLINNINLGNNFNIQPYLEAASLDQKIKNMKDGFSTFISEKSPLFSAGELQRIKIARTIALNRSIEFYDESTSALDDNLTEKIINYLTKRKDKTMIFVTHNKKFLNKFDKVYLLRNGYLLELNTGDKNVYMQ